MGADVRPICGSALIVTLALLALASPAGADEVEVRVLEDSGDRTLLDVLVPEPSLIPVWIDGQLFHHVKVEGSTPIKDFDGDPELPRISRSLIVPDDARMEVTVLESEGYAIEGVDVAPTKGILLRTVDPSDVPYFFGEVYDAEGSFPATTAELREPYILRDWRGVVLDLHPVRYDPRRRTLHVVERLRVEVATAGPGEANVFERSGRGQSREFEPLYANHFLNHDLRTALYPPVDEHGGMLIIAHDAWLGSVQPLVDHKNAIGIPTTAVGVSTIGNSSSAIGSRIASEYAAGNLAFVLLVGDLSQVASPTAWGAPTDPTYAQVAGNDTYPDLLIGRFSAESSAHVDTQVGRTIQYETLPATTQPWFKTAIGIGSNEGPGDDGEHDYQHIDHILDDLAGYGYTQLDEQYGNGASSSAIKSALNAGRGAVAYCGHGWIGGFVTGNLDSNAVNSLTNGGKLPFVVAVACNVGEFQSGTCFGESWLRATSGNQHTGGIGFYGSTVSQSWDPPMAAQDEVFDLLVAEQHISLGALLFAGSGRMMDEYGSTGVYEFERWHLFGDPSVRVFGIIEPTTGMSVTPSEGLSAGGQAGGPFTPSEAVYTLENHGDQSIDFEVVHGGGWLQVDPASGSLGPGGTAQVTVSLSAGAASLGNGQYEEDVHFVNATDHEGDADRTVLLEVGVPTLQHEWKLNEDPGWTADGEWAYGAPSGGGGEHGYPDPTSGHTGTHVYGYNLAGDYPNQLGQMHLTSSAIDCSYLTKTRLKFMRWLGVEDHEFDHASVSVSTDGQSWSLVWQNESELADAQWTEQEIDISAIADRQPSVYVRWTMGSTDEGWRYCGWNLDDIQIWGMGSADCWDVDGDGYLEAECGGDDCHDDDYDVHPNALEVCDDGVDNDCDGKVDRGGDCGPGDGESSDDTRIGAGGCQCRAGADARAALAWPWLTALALAVVFRRRTP